MIMQKLKALLFYATLIFIGGTIISFLTVNFLLKPSPATESPELVYAKTQAQLAELARNQESNIFWGHFFQAIAIGFALTILVGSWAAVAMIWRGFNHKIWVDQQNHRKSLTIIEPDQLGNYPLIRHNGEFVRYRPANPAFAAPMQPYGLLPEGKSRSNRPMEIAGETYSVHGPIPSRAPLRSPSRNNSSSAQDAQVRETEMRIVENLRSAKEGRRGKVKSIQRFCNVTPGDSEGYDKWSVIWDNL